MVRYIKSDKYGDIPLRLTISGVKRFEFKTGKKIFSGQSNINELTLDDMEKLFLVSWQKGCRADEIPFPQKVQDDPEELEDVFDDVYAEFFKILPQLFQDMSGKVVPEELEAQKAKQVAPIPDEKN